MKQDKIIKMFDEIAPTYDMANRVLSFGVDVRWRKIAAKMAYELLSGDGNDNSVATEPKIADIACGTGDMMAVWLDEAKRLNISPNIIGIDPSTKMLEVAKTKLKNCHFQKARADQTGLSDDELNIISISYGIRNVVELDAALNEFNRILKTGGLLVVLEFTKRENGGFMGAIRDFYLSKILPKIGAFISKNSAAYEYLPSSIDSFLDARSFALKLQKAGFEVIINQPFTLGISTLFIARKSAHLFLAD